MGDVEWKMLDEYCQRILNYCRYHLNYDEYAAEECTQEVFLIYFEKISKIEIRNKRAWLYRTADNCIKQYLSRIIKEKRKTIPFIDEEFVEKQGDVFLYEQNFDKYFDDKIDIGKIAGMVIMALSFNERVLYKLHFREHKTNKELSALFDTSVPGIKNRVYRLKIHITQIAYDLIEKERAAHSLI
jgi:RNA polymerase sigma factor (sigma-70 family)